MVIILIILMFVGYIYNLFFRVVPSGTLNCGLFGYSGENLPDYNAIKLLAIDSAKRGKDSTGVYGNGLFKTTDDSTTSVYSKEFRNAITSRLIIGHTRFATMGLKNAANAHPYEFDYVDQNGEEQKLIGSHNGWLIEPEWQAGNLGMEMPSVDSMLIFQKFIKDKHLGFAKLKELHGAMALAFTTDSRRLYLYKRRSKPLFIAQVSNGIYYSSRKEGLILAGFKNIIEAPNDEILGFEAGKLVDHRYYGAPEIVMPTDLSPYKWREYDFKGIIPSVWEIGKEKRKTENNRSSNYSLPFDTTDNTGRKKKQKNNSESKKYDHGRFLQKFEKDKELFNIRVTSGEINQSTHSDSDNSYVIANLEEAGASEKLSDFNLFLDCDPHGTLTKSSDNGLASMMVRCEEPMTVRVIVIPPDTNDGYYSKLITVNPRSVLEVTLSLLPFQKTQEWKEFKEQKEASNKGGNAGENEGYPGEEHPGDGEDERYLNGWRTMGEAEKYKPAAELMEELFSLVGPTLSMILNTKDHGTINFLKFSRPPVAKHVFETIFNGTESESTKYHVAMNAVEKLESTEEDFLSKGIDEIDLEMRNKYMVPLMSAIEFINDTASKDRLFPALGESIKAEGWWEVYRRLRIIVFDYLTLERDMLRSLCESYDISVYTEESLRQKSLQKWDRNEPYTIKIDGKEVRVGNKHVEHLNKAYDSICEIIPQFWMVEKPGDDSVYIELVSYAEELEHETNQILKAITSFWNTLKILSSSGYEKLGMDTAAVSNIMSSLDDAKEVFSIVSNMVSHHFDDDTVASLMQAEQVVSDALENSYEVLADALKSVNSQIPKNQILTF